jgi:hypothetical protein
MMMKIAVMLLWNLLFFDPVDVSVEKWIIEKTSNLSIEGKSNVNTFKCDIVEYLKEDTIFLYRNNALHQPTSIAKGGLTININRFDCHQNHITTDLKKTLRSKENGWMKINLLTLGYLQPAKQQQSIKGKVEIQLAGVTKTIEIDYKVEQRADGGLYLVGIRKLLFSDFGLVPPSKLAGLIKVDQEIKVSFYLLLRPVIIKRT